MISQHKRLELLSKITTAFKNVPIPRRSIGDRDELRHFKGKKWQDVAIEALRWNDSLAYFNNEGFHYYLPAYMTLILKSPDKVGENVRHSVIRELGSPEVMGYQYKLFDNKQRQAVLEFLRSQTFEELHPLAGARQNLTPRQIQLLQESINEYNALRQRAIDFWESS